MKWYPWLRPSFEQLVASYQAGRGHHALLLQALPGMGGDALIYALCRYLMCRQPEGNKSCGHCHSCQLMQAGTHPDYYTLAPEKGKSALGIDAVRDVNEKLYERSRLGGAKVVWIADAAQLTDAAANALLKTLEEPPENTWFFLVSQEPARLLATLRSRCRLYHLMPPAESYGLAWLEREVSLPQEALLSALRLSANAPAAALDLLQESHWAARQQLIAALENVLTSGDWLSLLSILNHEQAAVRLHWLASLLLDAQKRQQGITQVSNPDAWALVNQLARTLPAARLQAIARDVSTCRDRLLNVVGVNRELLLTERLLRWEHYLQPGTVLPVSHL
ncbi:MULTISPECIES: DNA polymerase III subunit delta' [Enterobacteriaceae]|uniref:DNA polymerase III subunit delta' n=1 Tax=Raoultella lignicola TaxID=3040939 RepID=A0ABU9FFE6_9ENTR|nr:MULTISPECIES: DNA polymerase III subunit delta' [Enterobacteriaceae]MRT51750.1 DNA polymerase III subunit delta' [Raoultella sp. RIT712]QNK09571.1 DNA polymerase III subunit delta' [Enterobacter sp. JUb54]ROS15181.1 DNA polymerase-3 subunit delta' [Raoultella sp. BIGb0399]